MSKENESLDPELLDLLEDDLLYNEDSPDNKDGGKEEETQDKLEETQEKLDEALKDRSKFINTVMDNEDPELAYNVLLAMDLWENPKHKEDKSRNREKLSQNYWALYREMITNITDKDFSKEKIKFIRYGLLDTDYLTERQLELMNNIDKSNQTEVDSLYLADEWFYNIAKGDIKPSVLDEVTQRKRKGPSKEKVESKKGQLDAEIKSAKLKIDKLKNNENNMQELVNNVCQHASYKEIKNDALIEPYQSSQRDALTKILEAGRQLLTLDKQLKSNYKVIERLQAELDRLEEALEKGEDFTQVAETLYNEFQSYRQMVKMCAGRQGNHFPILYKNYFSGDKLNIATKSNVEKTIKEVEKLDPKLFYRTYKGEEHRIYPYVLIVPSYGNKGICWEPFARSNKATSKGRIIVPMYPKNLKGAILTALADLRWQTAKDKAQHYWMEEGLTGHYYEYYTNEKLKGNIKSHFINDYILWIAWESKGVQRLHKDVRPVFWRYTPFPQKVKESLKNRGYYYRELLKKDENRAKSDGY